MKKITLILMMLLPLVAISQKKWGKEVWDAYMNSCVETAKTGMSEKDARDYCSCTASKLEKRYPNAADLGNLGEDEINELAIKCLEEENIAGFGDDKADDKKNNDKAPTPPGKTSKNEYVGATNWSKAGYDSFMTTCVDGAKDALGGEKEAKKYCDCSASKLQDMYPDEAKVGNVTEDEINKVAAECLGN